MPVAIERVVNLHHAMPTHLLRFAARSYTARRHTSRHLAAFLYAVVQYVQQSIEDWPNEREGWWSGRGVALGYYRETHVRNVEPLCDGEGLLVDGCAPADPDRVRLCDPSRQLQSSLQAWANLAISQAPRHYGVRPGDDTLLHQCGTIHGLESQEEHAALNNNEPRRVMANRHG